MIDRLGYERHSRKMLIDVQACACNTRCMNEKRASSRNDLMSAREASELLPGTGYQALLRWAKTGEVPHVRLPNGRIFFRRSDIEALLEPVGGDRVPDSGGAGAATLPGLGKAGR